MTSKQVTNKGIAKKAFKDSLILLIHISLITLFFMIQNNSWTIQQSDYPKFIFTMLTTLLMLNLANYIHSLFTIKDHIKFINEQLK